jgi:hypothetical protein
MMRALGLLLLTAFVAGVGIGLGAAATLWVLGVTT